MEIWSYLWARRGRIVLLMLLPLMVAGVSAFYVSRTSNTEVIGALEIPLPTTATASGTDAQIANFIAAAQGDGVRTAIAEEFGLGKGVVKANLEVTRIDPDGTYVRIQYTSDSGADLGALLTSVASRATSALLDPLIAAQQASRQTLIEQYAAIGDTGSPQLSSGQTKGLSENQLIRQQQQLLLSNLSSVNQQLTFISAQKEAALITAEDESAVTTSTTTRNAQVLKTMLLNSGIALFIAIVLIVAWDTVRPRREPGSAVDPGQGEGTTAPARA